MKLTDICAAAQKAAVGNCREFRPPFKFELPRCLLEGCATNEGLEVAILHTGRLHWLLLPRPGFNCDHHVSQLSRGDKLLSSRVKFESSSYLPLESVAPRFATPMLGWLLRISQCLSVWDLR